MSVLDQVDADQLADGDAPLTVDDVEALLAGVADDRIQRPAAAWMTAYRRALWLGFGESTALKQAANAWDWAVEAIADVTAIASIEVN